MAPTAVPPKARLDWVDALKAFALLGILLNHLVEEFGPGPWFTNPTEGWPELSARLDGILPRGFPWPVGLVQFAGWLGDSGPGVFILASGFSLTWARLHAGPEGYLRFLRRRLLRLLPLYVAVHFVILAGALLVPGNELSLGSRHTLLSLLGLRFTESLFFYISPSWWFVWTILQLYAVFPPLAALLERAGPRRFMAAAVSLTFAIRGLALLGLHGANLYYWMTGLFFGTRLAEFALGMAVADALVRRLRSGAAVPSPRRVLAAAVPAYALGFLCSLTWWGSVASNLLVTAGLSGIFFFAWEAVVSRTAPVARATRWVGRNSYGVFLLHQPPLMWTRYLGAAVVHLTAALAVLAASFPLSAWLEKAVGAIESLFRGGDTRAVRVAGWAGTALAVVGLALVEPALPPGAVRPHAALALALGLAVVGMALSARAGAGRLATRCLRGGVLAACVLALFVLPEGLGHLALAIGLLAGLTTALAHSVARRPLVAWVLGAAAAAAIVGGVEAGLWRFRPMEAAGWGERPALERHRTRVYSLKPSRATRLRYNNYDYVVRSNALGLASPDIALRRPTADTFRVLVAGDAFSMPEGLEYEESWPALLESRLGGCLAPRRVQVVNAGVTGYGPVEEAAQLRELAPLFRPDVIVWEFFVNEFSEARVRPEERLADIGLSSVPSPLSRGALERTQVAAHARRLKALAVERLTGRPARWRYDKALLEYYRTGENDVYSADSLAALKSRMQDIQATADGTGARLMIYFVPAAAAVSDPRTLSYFPWDQDVSDRAAYDLGRPLEHLRQVAAPLGLPVVDLSPFLRSHPAQPVYFADSWHWNREGHRAAAEAVARTLATEVIGEARCTAALMADAGGRSQ